VCPLFWIPFQDVQESFMHFDRFGNKNNTNNNTIKANVKIDAVLFIIQ